VTEPTPRPPAGEQLTQAELVEILTGLNIGLTDPIPLSPQQARRVASVVWHRVEVHRNRAYTLGYLHGANNHNAVCEGVIPALHTDGIDVDQPPLVLFDEEGAA